MKIINTRCTEFRAGGLLSATVETTVYKPQTEPRAEPILTLSANMQEIVLKLSDWPDFLALIVKVINEYHDHLIGKEKP